MIVVDFKRNLKCGVFMGRLTRDEKYLYRARCFAQFMMTSRAFAEEASSPDRPYRDVVVCLLVSWSVHQFLMSNVWTECKKFTFWVTKSITQINGIL